MIDTGASGRQYITLDGQRLGYIAVGDRNAPPVVLVHGWPGYLVKERVPGSQLALI